MSVMVGIATASGRATHHGLAGHEVVLLMETDPHNGLTEEEAADRRIRFGPNVCPEPDGSVQRAGSCGSLPTRSCTSCSGPARSHSHLASLSTPP
jgi:hypothetical protein